MDNIRGKTIAITGAARGIGFATARALLQRGARVVIGDRDVALEESAVAQLTKLGPVSGYPLDVADPESFATFLDKARADGGGHIDVLINNAGVMPISPLDELRVDDWEAMIDTNLKGVLYGIAAALPVFRRQGFGHFVNTASTAAFRVTPSQSVYAGTKMAVRAISEGLRQEAGPDLRVTIISPGMTSTGFADSITDSAVRTQLEQRRDEIAMPSDAVARAIAFAIEQPADVDVGEIVVRPTAQD
jgi:NADP-dependent 3-hydroxy acid dehydrogenase YdfG